ncbi:MAG: hypothetical protein M0Z61_05590 [Nitrospiraceae bacterium]|nr:hypothetical protein [Nitrospiraceae bacterium]
MKKVLAIFAVLSFASYGVFASGCRAEGHGIFAEISKAKAILKTRTPGYEICGGRICNADILLAVRDPNGQIETVKIDHTGQVLGNDRIQFDDLDRGMGATFSIKGKGYAILAMKRAVRGRDGQIEDEIYVPYSKEMDTPGMRRRGLAYLRLVVARARKKLKALKVRSRVYPGKLVADTVPSDVPVTIAIIEHIDPDDFSAYQKARKPITPLIDKVLVTLALNGDRAYRFCGSRAGALGLFQFTRPTYNLVCRQYSGASLCPRFAWGAEDHVNAAMASFLLFDSDLKKLDKRRLNYFRRRPELKRLFIAASYNEGPKRAAHNRILDETKNYIQKFRAVWNNFFRSAKKKKRKKAKKHFA